MRKLHAFLFFGITVLLWLSCSSHGQESLSRPKLILVLSIDQMRFDYLTRFADLYKAGLHRMLAEGAVFTNAKYRHANTETGPGHSVILSGRHASHSGIVANTWYDPLLKKSINVVDDPVQITLGGKGRRASPANFMGFTIGDLIKLESAVSRVVGVSMKDRSAILMAGRRGDGAFWFENEGGHFVTSSYYMAEAPEWLSRWNSRKFADQFAGKRWERVLSDPGVYEKYAGPDAVEGEWDRKDIVFPHAIRSAPPNKEFYEDFRRTPFADEMILDLVREVMSAYALGQDSYTDVLAVGFSATDVIGHTYGAQSQEVLDQMLRLDQTLGSLFDLIDARVGKSNTWTVLTADHGSLPLVELLQKHGLNAKRVRSSSIQEIVLRALRSEFPNADGLIANFDSPNFYLDEEIIARNGLKRKVVEQVIVGALMATGDFESVYTQSQILDPEFQGGEHLSLIRNSFYQPRSPHIIATPRQYVYISDNVGGTGHGTPHDYDRHVPIVFMGPAIKPGRYGEPRGPEDIAPTLAKMLALPGLKKEDDARTLDEMLR